MALSPRLTSLLDLLQPCELLADIGTDHALLPIAAVQRNVAVRALGIDREEAPLRQAWRNVRQAQLQKSVQLIRGDGLLPLRTQPADAVVIAGLTGPTVVRLLMATPELLASVHQVVVQPNRDLFRVRAWALAHGWHLRDEQVVQDGRFFASCAFRRGEGPDPAYALPGWSEAELCRLGPLLLARRDPVALRSYTEQQARSLGWLGAPPEPLIAEAAFWRRVMDHVHVDT